MLIPCFKIKIDTHYKLLLLNMVIDTFTLVLFYSQMNYSKCKVCKVLRL